MNDRPTWLVLPLAALLLAAALWSLRTSLGPALSCAVLVFVLWPSPFSWIPPSGSWRSAASAAVWQPSC